MANYEWMIAVCNTSTDGIKLFRFFGTEDEVKTKLAELVCEDGKKFPATWEYGTCEADEISAVDAVGHEYYGYGVYGDFHIDYTAKKFSNIEHIN